MMGVLGSMIPAPMLHGCLCGGRGGGGVSVSETVVCDCVRTGTLSALLGMLTEWPRDAFAPEYTVTCHAHHADIPCGMIFPVM